MCKVHIIIVIKHKRQYGEELYVNLFSIKTYHQRVSWTLYTARSMLINLKSGRRRKIKMKRIIALFIIFTLSVAIVGCNNDTKTYTSEELAQNLRLIKNNKNDSEGGTKFIDDNDSILTKVKEMNIVEFQKFASTYKSINFKKYTFVLFDEDILIIVKYSNDYSKIIDVKIMNNIIPTETNKNQLMKGQSVDEVVSLMGYPYMITMSSENSLSFKLTNEEIIKVIFDENMHSIKIIHIDFESIKDPSYAVDEKCDPNENPKDIESAILISENMCFEEVVALMGKPQRSFGSGAIWYEWDLKENKSLKVMFGRKSMNDDNLYVIKYYIK